MMIWCVEEKEVFVYADSRPDYWSDSTYFFLHKSAMLEHIARVKERPAKGVVIIDDEDLEYAFEAFNSKGCVFKLTVKRKHVNTCE